MSDLTKKQFFPRTGVTETACIPLRLTTIVAGLLLMVMPFLTGCGGGGQTGSEPSAVPVGNAVSLSWDPVPDPSVSTYFVHYGRYSPGQQGDCSYESFMSVTAQSSATVTNLDPNTRYYFTVRAYNGLYSACSIEVSTVTPPAPV